jgi:hypothetical protein
VSRGTRRDARSPFVIPRSYTHVVRGSGLERKEGERGNSKPKGSSLREQPVLYFQRNGEQEDSWTYEVELGESPIDQPQLWNIEEVSLEEDGRTNAKLNEPVASRDLDG